jgi:hypothetical protein
MQNPGLGPVNIRVGLMPAAGEERALQSVSLFPVDRPAVFSVRLPHDSTPARIVLTLIPSISRLAVELGPIEFQYEEPR